MKDKLKSFFLNHGEKLGFGLIIVMTLYVLWGTRWSPYDKNPEDLLTAAKDAEAKIIASEWPPEKTQELTPAKNIVDRSQALLGGINDTKYAFSTPIYTPIYPRSEPILPPNFLPPKNAIATADVVLIETRPDIEDPLLGEGDDTTNSAEKNEDESEIPKALQTRTRPSAGSLEGDLTYGDSETDLGALIDPCCGGALMSDMMGEGNQTVSRNGEGFRFVAVRSILNWAAQKIAFSKALHLPPNEAARTEPRILNFEIQRQQATNEDQPWTGEWVTLDIENSRNVLKNSYDFEADIVDVSVTDPAITAPLPRRVIGLWDKQVTHPDITNFRLSPEEQEREQLRMQKLIDAYEAINAANRQSEPPEVGGYTDLITNVRSMTNEMSMGGGSEMMEEYQNDYTTEMNSMYSSGNTASRFGRGTPGAGKPGAPGSLLDSARSAASGRLLLFRYFDFDVTPGAVYRYRMRIVFENPNFGKPIELLASPELAEGPTRTSDWSEPTPPVQVLPEAEFYLTGVEQDRSTEVAAMDVYKWNAPTGSVVNELKRYAVGEEIGGLIKTKVVNHLDESFESQNIKLNTGNIVIDLRDQNELVIDADLPDLNKVPADVRFDEVLVMNPEGNLRTFDRFTRESQRAKARRFQKFQDDIGKKYEEAAAEALNSEDLLEGYGDCGEGMYGDVTGGRPPGSAAATRRSRRSGGGGGCGP